MWAYNLIVNNIVRSKYIFVENDNIEILLTIINLTILLTIYSDFLTLSEIKITKGAITYYIITDGGGGL